MRRRIARTGSISIADYMAVALGHPQYGYYMHRDPFGAPGDFVTAPEISQIFGELIGLWCVVVWEQMAQPAPVLLTELGPGRGTLLADALRAATSARPEFAAAVRLHLVETSPFLRERQRICLAATHPGLEARWHDRLENVPKTHPLLLIANEFFDALPIRQYVRTNDRWQERRIGLRPDGSGFVFVLEAVSNPTLPEPTEYGSVVERCPAAARLAYEIGARVTRHGGAALIIDYGYSHGASAETLQSVRHHAFHDVLDHPGDADLTAHVDFGALLAAARGAGARTYGPIPQGAFLARLGIEPRTEALLERATSDQATAIATAFRRLVHPAEMGLMFKAVAVASPDLPPPPGFDA
ncbi:MAG TPA: SAM-dependent methyltransferase [Candidatus Limnocylindria bacterium]|nr:SAM-dependent methyltransferase [Candidatus Limnocylindria bacterium]